MLNRKPFTGMIFCFTGQLRAMTRTRAHSMINDLGGRTTNQITSRTNVLVLGLRPGSKLQAARDSGTEIWSETKFIDTLNKHTYVAQQMELP